MKTISLTKGKIALVDDDDYEELIKFKWCTLVGKHTFYAIRKSYKDGRRINLGMHRVIMNTPNDLIVDHIDGNGLNNCKTNLRNTTIRGNAQNRHDITKSIYPGVAWHKKTKKVESTIYM